MTDQQGGLKDQGHPLDHRAGPWLERPGIGQIDVEIVHGPGQAGVPTVPIP